MPLYLILDICAILIPLIFSFHKRLHFYKQWPALFLSIGIVGLVFITWDSLFTRMGVWGFNPGYLTGIYLLNLPVEEYLFFICVPFASVFTFHVFRTLMPEFTMSGTTLKTLMLFPALALIITGLIFYTRWYTATTFILAGTSLWYAYLKFKKLLPHFIISFGAILLPFFIMNGILTGSMIDKEVVWYNDQENLGIRLFTIPLEDIFYGMLLILWNVILTYYFNQRRTQRQPV